MRGLLCAFLIVTVTASPSLADDQTSSTLYEELVADGQAPALTRHAGADRYATAAALALETFASGADHVFVATGTDFPDATVAAGPAGTAGSPILLTSPTALPRVVRDALNRLDPGSITLVGGLGAVGAAVETDLESIAPVTRVAGPDRYATAAELAITQFPSGSDTVYVATGERFPDASVAAASAALDAAPVLLTPSDGLTAGVKSALAVLRPTRIVIVGGPAAVDAETALELEKLADEVERIYGIDRYATATELAEATFDRTGGTVFLATGEAFADAVVASAAAAAQGQALVLTRPHELPAPTRRALERRSLSRVEVVGGTAAVDDRVLVAVVATQDRLAVPTETMRPVPLDSKSLKTWEGLPRDNQGVVQYPAFSDPYHPLLIARYATTLYTNWYLTGDESYLEGGRLQVRWLLDNLDCQNGVGVWRYNFAADFGTEPGWFSAMMHGYGMVALLQYAQFEANASEHLEAIECALGSFYTDVLDGGTLTVLGPGDFHYEEVAVPSRPQILNGHIFAVQGLGLVGSAGGSAAAALLYDFGVESVRRHISEYDTGFASLYALAGTPFVNYAGPERVYNRVHVDQLLWLWHVTADPVFYEYAHTITKYLPEALASMTSDSSTDEASILDDRDVWFFDWTSLAPTTVVEFTVAQATDVTSLAVFARGIHDDLPSTTLTVGTGEHQVLELTQITHRDVGNYRTTIFLLTPPRALNGDSFTLTLAGRFADDTFVLSEIDPHLVQYERVDARYTDLLEQFDR